MKQHKGTFETCHYCQNYVRLGESFGRASEYAATTRRLHRQAINRQERAEAMKDMGLVRGRDSLGRTIWE